MKVLKVSQLTEYERRRLNKARQCVICGKRIHDYDLIIMNKRRDARKVQYAFAHAECGGDEEREDLWLNLIFSAK